MKPVQGVSVVIPNYNCLQTLPRAIESVRVQDCLVEIIVVDDGSTDGSREWLAEQNDIKLIFSERGGASKARNLAIQHCKYELVAFLDADDYWVDGKLIQQLALHKVQPELVFSFSDYMHVTESGREIIGCFDFWPRFKSKMRGENRSRVFEHFTPLLFAENVVGTSTVVVKKSALISSKGFDVRLKSASDWDLWLKVARMGPVGVINEPLCYYTSDRAGAISRDYEKRLNAVRTILNRHSGAIIGSPFDLFAGYLRWIAGKAEYNRIKHSYLLSVCQELLVLCFQPNLRRVKAVGGDILKMVPLKQTKLM